MCTYINVVNSVYSKTSINGGGRAADSPPFPSYASDCLVFLPIIQESRILMVAIIIDLDSSWSLIISYYFLYFVIFSHIIFLN